MTPSIGATGRNAGGLAPLTSSITVWLSARTSVPIVPIWHPVIETLGHRPASEYGEQFWLPTLGPTSLWIYRRLATRFADSPGGFEQDLSALGREIGVGAGTGRNSPVVRAVSRLVDFHLAQIIDDRLGVSTHLPPLTRRQVARLPEHLATRHRILAGRSLGGVTQAIDALTVEAAR